MLATVVASPFFAAALIMYGVAHLIFIGEPKRALKHHAWTYVSWSIVVGSFAAIIGPASWGGLQVYVAREVTARVNERFWHLTEDQKSRLGRALGDVEEDQRFPVTVRVVLANAQALTVTDDLAGVFHQHGWAITITQDSRLRADLIGINFVVAVDWGGRTDKDFPPYASELTHIFDKANIKYTGAWDPGFDNNRLELAIGSRPPDW